MCAPVGLGDGVRGVDRDGLSSRGRLTEGHPAAPPLRSGYPSGQPDLPRDRGSEFQGRAFLTIGGRTRVRRLSREIGSTSLSRPLVVGSLFDRATGAFYGPLARFLLSTRSSLRGARRSSDCGLRRLSPLGGWFPGWWVCGDGLFREDHFAEVVAGLVESFLVGEWCGVPGGEVFGFDQVAAMAQVPDLP